MGNLIQRRKGDWRSLTADYHQQPRGFGTFLFGGKKCNFSKDSRKFPTKMNGRSKFQLLLLNCTTFWGFPVPNVVFFMEENLPRRRKFCDRDSCPLAPPCHNAISFHDHKEFKIHLTAATAWDGLRQSIISTASHSGWADSEPSSISKVCGLLSHGGHFITTDVSLGSH